MRFLMACLFLTLLWQPPTHAQASDTLSRVLATRTLRICIWPDYHGITYRNPRTQQLSGMDIDLARAFAQDLGPGIGIRFVDSNFVTLIEDLRTECCDIAMFAIGITPARAAQIHFTRPYLRSDIYAITTVANRRIQAWKDIDQPGVVVAVSRGTYHETVMRERIRHARLVVLETPFAREQEVLSGRADVFMTDYPYSQHMLRNADWARLVAPPAPFHLTDYGYAVRSGDERWHARVDRFVSDIQQDGRLRTAAAQHQLTPVAVFD
ncbi:MAG: amino acid ABC transporter substrate-binding protein [Candidatus Dactylopiibacterium carminicum]|uniref:Amino acid ABC transporter substrate-binding protein n=1 Tax=Candidatus Dactylopiibacterium carminicum TaxID=857335 RepID=A0A272ET53_9RHOO|nr:ABC transporter substrate-binding protein [Candidatus Dactylopiibacterium carminicum]KAF7599160.1 amino acid ABC transporter substrate-binding protein [Candidatus Dactylopiibacterium carminicum]PAS93268.1 MAG: amino acid ABC transporter substrate-binding protein [Candidatus Dactylopiibacterium carminicum]PAS97097.1 MAG: amino acid ABC transporter substrate-binding protein [Candidatus Dactylopiibacterium carminicum]PAS99174.1 MAG: amino acid ABC transporter substrate-binding protein [Candidat